jgi:hypothetical protein
MNEERIPKVLNMKVKGKCPRGRRDQVENNRLGKMSNSRKEGHGKKSRRRSCEKTEIDGETSLSEPLKVEMS